MKNQGVKELVKEIKDNFTQVSSSAKDEERVMRAMLNDREYKVGIYSKEGKIGEMCPAEEARDMITSVISATTKMRPEEARKLADEHEFKKSEAQSFINISKEFVNTYMDTRRKLPLGGRETSDVALSIKQVQAKTTPYPVKVGVNEDGTDRFDRTGVAKIPAHRSIRVHGSCPAWLKK